MIERVLRAIAIGIAVLAFVDPSVTLASRRRPRVSLVVQSGASMDLPARSGSATRRGAATQVRERIRQDLDSDFEVIDGLDPTAAAVVVVGDRYPDETFADESQISTVTVSAPISPNVQLVSVNAPVSIPPGTAVPIAAELVAHGVRGETTMLVARSGSIEVGRATHAWTADEERWRATLDVMPVGAAPFTFDIEAQSLRVERTAADNAAIVSVERAEPLRVFAYEARPSWAGAFVRRAVEDDPRFAVSGLSLAAPHAVVRTGEEPAFPAAALDRVDLIVVSGVERVSASVVDTLGRFMRERGGSVALLPDTRFDAAPIASLVPAIVFRETLLEQPAALVAAAPLPRIDASELLSTADLPRGADALARLPGSNDAVVWTQPYGSGRLLLSGAMDAWRYRVRSGVENDRFWRQVLAGLALAARPAVDVELTPPRAAPGERARVKVRVRALEGERLGDRLAVSARTASGEPIRLWPEAPRGAFAGSFVVPPAQRDPMRVLVAIEGEDAVGSARLVIDPHARDAADPPLSLLSATHRGVDVGPGDLTTLERHLRDTIPASTAAMPARPMRSAWWFLPFAAALAAEWSLRRRRGLR